MVTYDTTTTTANQALANANTAQGTANNAVGAAGSAQTAANNAKTTADTGVSNANLAQQAANNADGKAVAAQQDVNTLDTGLRAEYTLKIDVDPNNSDNVIIGGFGLALENDNTINAGFNVDKFWIGEVGDTYNSAKVPFVVQNGTTYIKNAAIANGAIDTAKIGILAVDTANIQCIGAINAARIGTAAVDTLRIKGRAITSNRYTRSTSTRTWNDGVGWNLTPVWLYVTMDDIGVGNTETIPVVLSLDFGWTANRKNNVPPAVNIHDIDIEYQYRDLSTGSFVYSALEYATVGTVGFDSQNVVSHGLSSSAVRLQIPSYSQLRFRLRRDRQAAWTSTSDTDAQMQDFKIFLTVLIASMNFR